MLNLLRRKLKRPIAGLESRATPLQQYDFWSQGHIFGHPAEGPRSILSGSWEPGTLYYQLAIDGLMAAEIAYAKDLLDDLDARHVSGAIIEFGVFEGMWLSHITDHVYQRATRRDIWGLDSFEGLPPTDANDLDCFFEGQFSASMPAVSARLRVEERPAVRLVKGWFADTLPTQQMQGVKQIAFARIDCDLYQPTVECLEYLTTRLVDGAVLVFDDWTWNLDKGETKACREWIGRGLPLRLEFLAYGVNGHVYFRVRR